MSLARSSAAAAAASVLFLASAPVGQAAGGAPPAPSSNAASELTEAQLMIDRKDWTGALVELKRALRKDRKNPDVHNLMGYSYRKSGQLEEAFDSYRTALRLDPNHRAAHEYIGEAYLQVNQADKAREHLAALKRICGEQCEQYQDLAKALSVWQPPAKTAATTK
jgi:Flp pilus assembly protein TadD